MNNESSRYFSDLQRQEQAAESLRDFQIRLPDLARDLRGIKAALAQILERLPSAASPRVDSWRRS
jgi:hypothetical protein